MLAGGRHLPHRAHLRPALRVQHFVPNLLERAIVEVTTLKPDVVVCSGDLTTNGFRAEYARGGRVPRELECEHLVVIPGNHDSRNVGYVHFEDHFGARSSVSRLNGMTIVAVDSSEPDLDHGRSAAAATPGSRSSSRSRPSLRIFVLHHHLLSVPGTGRERSIVYDAGDILELLGRSNVNLVLSGHKHVPYAWRLEDIFVVNTGTVSRSA